MRQGYIVSPDSFNLYSDTLLIEMDLDLLMVERIFQWTCNDAREEPTVTLPKKLGPNECELLRIISRIGQLTKLMKQILMNRTRIKITPKIKQEQWVSVKDIGTRHAIPIIRMISRRVIQMQQDAYLCFIGYPKAFEKVRHKDLFELLWKTRFVWKIC